MSTSRETPVRYNSQTQQVEAPLVPRTQELFKKYDTDGDGKISLSELRNMIKSQAFAKDIPHAAVRRIMRKADEDRNGYLDAQEFDNLINSRELGEILDFYIRTAIVPRRGDTVDGTGEYEELYSCYPPSVCMLLVSIILIITFVIDVALDGSVTASGTTAKIFIYNPHKRYEAWRFITYMFVHVGVYHLVVNLLVQILLGIPLEMVHHWWRVLIVYLCGVIFGSLGTSISDPNVFLAGASGGVYALITAHLATVIMNWAEMRFAVLQLLVFSLIIISDLGTAIYNRYVLNTKDQIGYAAHLAGALAGLLIGLNVLRNIDVKPWEKVLRWVSIGIFCILLIMAIIWNAAFPNYFPISE